MSNDTKSIFPSSVRSKIIYWLLGAIAVGVGSYFTLFADKNYTTEAEGEELRTNIEAIEDDYVPKAEVKVISDRVRLVEDGHIKMNIEQRHTNEKLDTIIRFMEREHSP